MWNKLLLILLLGTAAFSLSAQQYRRYRSRRGRDRSTQTTTVQQTKAEEANKKKTDSSAVMTVRNRSTSNKLSGKFDPKKPELSQSQIDYVMNNQIRTKLLECNISAKLPGHKENDEEVQEDGEKTENGRIPEKFTFVSLLDFSRLMSRYNSLIANFELVEVSSVRPEWYQRYQTELRKFGPIINEMTFAIRSHSSSHYAAGVQKFKAHQEACLKFLKEKPPRISKEQYQALVLKNSKIRQQNYLKKLKEEREAAIKSRQEQLKQLQQKNQQKNQQNQKPMQGAGK